MTFAAGTKLLAYEIIGPLGAGGMGEVYRARDLKLKREVAIKVLPETFSRDHERVARFRREAEVLASLNHQHVAAIHDMVESEGSRFLVLEFVDGETLRERLRRGPIPPGDVLQIANQISKALKAAHEKGITHRDLKPENIKIASNGNVKVLDFGLAKVRVAGPQNTGLSNSPTVMSATSTPGTILGTAPYMSPEQVKGQEADHTSDVWAFGCLVYEMLSGHMAFEAASVAETLSEILKSDPDWARLPAETPTSIRRLVRRCLQKDPDLRLHDIADAWLEIHDAQTAPPTDEREGDRSRPRMLSMATSLLFGVVTGGLMVATLMRVPPASTPQLRLDITSPPTTDPVSIALSPDGRKLLFVATSEGRPRLWLRSLGAASAQPLQGTEDAMFPFWAPDSRSVGFFTDNKLKRIDTVSGEVQSLAVALAPRGGTWNSDGVIVFAPTSGGPLFRVSATGGEVKAVTRLRNQPSHRFPQFLPDGHHFLFYAQGTPEVRGVYIGDLHGAEPVRLFDKGDGNSPTFYVNSGYLVFVSDGTLFGQRFDPVGLKLIGGPIPIAATPTSGNAISVHTAAGEGPIIYRVGGGTSKQLVWFDRSGKELGKVGGPQFGFHPALSPDGRTVALRLSSGGNNDVWLMDAARGVPSRLTSDPGIDMTPVWSPNGERIVFMSNRNGEYDLFTKTVTDSTPENQILAVGGASPVDWSADGTMILFESSPKRDLWVLPIRGDVIGKPYPVVASDYDDRLGQFSPDQRWIAYQSNESGNMDIYAEPLSGPDGKSGRKIRISTNGGTQVRWRRDGRELFYLSADSKLTAVPIQMSADGLTIQVGTPVILFSVHMSGAWAAIPGYEYMVAADGQRFLVNTAVDQPAPPMTAVFNWKPE